MKENDNIKNLKFGSKALKVLSGITAVVKTPITSGLAIAFGLGSVVLDFMVSENEELQPATR